MIDIKLEDFIKGKQIIHELLNPKNRLIMVTGGSDTGKTTLTRCIAHEIAKEVEVGIVDLDMGQSHIGMPTTVAWGKIKGEFRKWSSIRIKDFYFTGALSPCGSLLPTVVGAKLITESALSSTQRVIVDTTGLIDEPIGRVLKQFKIDLLSPDIIIGLERSNELGAILEPFQSQNNPRVYRLPVPTFIDTKSISERKQYRCQKFKSYFAGAKSLEVSLKAVTVRFTREAIKLKPEELEDRIASFRDKRNRDLALGIVERVKVKDKILFIRSPIIPDVKFSSLVIGMTKIYL